MIINKDNLLSNNNNIFIFEDICETNRDIYNKLIDNPNYKCITNKSLIYKSFLAINFSNKNDDDMIKILGYNGIPIISFIDHDSPNVIYVNKYENELNYYIEFVNNNYYKYKDVIISSTKSFYEKKNRINNVVYVPVYGRHELLGKCLQSLINQSNINTKIFCICSNDKDIEFVTRLNIDYISSTNLPLGRKYQNGIIFSKIYYPYCVNIIGSDDVFTLNYIDNIITYHNKYEIVGKRNWIIESNDIIYDARYDQTKRLTIKKVFDSNKKSISSKDMNKYKKMNLDKKIFPLILGAGRSIKYTLLNRCNWQIYPVNLNRKLDTTSLLRMIINDCNFVSIYTFKYNIISLKKEQDMINSIESLKKSSNIILKEII